MIIDCQGCPVRGRGCADCVVNVLLPAAPDTGISDSATNDTELEPVIRQAIDLFAEAGMLPRPHLVSSRPDVSERSGRPDASARVEPVRRSRARPRRRSA